MIRMIEKSKKLIIYLFLLVFVLTGMGYGFNENWQFYLSDCYIHNCEINGPEFVTVGEIYSFQLCECNVRSVLLRNESVRNGRIDGLFRWSFFCICLLTILSVLVRLFQDVFVYYARLYVYERFSIIRFIHDTDGRKRIS